MMGSSVRPSLEINIWSDIACPWQACIAVAAAEGMYVSSNLRLPACRCYVGHKRLQQALHIVQPKDAPVKITWSVQKQATLQSVRRMTAAIHAGTPM